MSIKREYKKERKRVLALLNRYKKAEYVLDFEEPKIPKRVTRASINKLRKITPQYVREHSRVTDLDTGLLIDGKKGFKKYGIKKQIEKLKEIKKDVFDFRSDIVINNFKDMLKKFPKKAEPILGRWIDSVISKCGKERTAGMLLKSQDAGIVLTNEIAYDEVLRQGYVNALLSYMPDVGVFEFEELEDSYDYIVDNFYMG